MSGGARAPALLLTCWLLGCSLGAPEPIPLAGPTPHTILILPVRGSDLPPDVAPALLTTLGPALRRRGYHPLPVAASHDLLEARGLRAGAAEPIDRYAEAARDLGADAFLTLRVETWRAMYAPNLIHLTHDLGYRLWDAATGALLWELRSRDTWNWDEEPSYDPSSELESYLGPGVERSGQSPYRDSVDVARAIHRRALEYLPVRS